MTSLKSAVEFPEDELDHGIVFVITPFRMSTLRLIWNNLRQTFPKIIRPEKPPRPPRQAGANVQLVFPWLAKK